MAGTMESDIFKYCMPSGQQEATHSNPTQKKQRQETSNRFQGRRRPFGLMSSTHQLPAQPVQDPTLRLMSRLLLKHEEALALQRKEKNFVLFFRQDVHSFLPNFMSR